jgi:hypothetical protein
MVRMRGVTTMGVGWVSEEASGLVVSPLNLVLYIHLRIHRILSLSVSNIWNVCWFWNVEEHQVLSESCLFTDRVPVMKLICSTFQS